MARTLINLQGPQELILEKALELGLYKTKAEAVRGAINELGREYKIFKDAQALEDELVIRKMLQEEKETKTGKRKIISEEEVKKKYGFKWLQMYELDYKEDWDKYFKKMNKEMQTKIWKKIQKLKELESARHLKLGLPFFVVETNQYRITFKQIEGVRTIWFVGNHKQYEKLRTQNAPFGTTPSRTTKRD